MEKCSILNNVVLIKNLAKETLMVKTFLLYIKYGLGNDLKYLNMFGCFHKKFSFYLRQIIIFLQSKYGYHAFSRLSHLAQ